MTNKQQISEDIQINSLSTTSSQQTTTESKMSSLPSHEHVNLQDSSNSINKKSTINQNNNQEQATPSNPDSAISHIQNSQESSETNEQDSEEKVNAFTALAQIQQEHLEKNRAIQEQLKAYNAQENASNEVNNEETSSELVTNTEASSTENSQETNSANQENEEFDPTANLTVLGEVETIEEKIELEHQIALVQQQLQEQSLEESNNTVVSSSQVNIQASENTVDTDNTNTYIQPQLPKTEATTQVSTIDTNESTSLSNDSIDSKTESTIINNESNSASTQDESITVNKDNANSISTEQETKDHTSTSANINITSEQASNITLEDGKSLQEAMDAVQPHVRHAYVPKEEFVEPTLFGIRRKVWSVWFVFFSVGCLYSQFTGRLPAFREHLSIDEAQVGMLLMGFSTGSLIGLLSSGFVMARLQSKTVIQICLTCFAIGLVALTFIDSYEHMIIAFAFWGFVCAFVDVGKNAQAIYLEQYFKQGYLGAMHATYSVGCVFGSAVASAFAFSNLSISPNFIAVGIFILLLLSYFKRDLLPDLDSLTPKAPPAVETNKKRSFKQMFMALPFFIFLCGMMSLLSYTAEGSVAEWGGLVMHSAKGASEGLSALAYGVLASMMALTRYSVDRLRRFVPDLVLILGGSMIAALSMCMVIYTSSPIICLISYAFLGLGIAPISPIAVSRAGSSGLVPAKVAATIVCIIGYIGFLVIPPIVGQLASHYGLERALFLPLGALMLVMILSFFFAKGRHQALKTHLETIEQERIAQQEQIASMNANSENNCVLTDITNKEKNKEQA